MALEATRQPELRALMDQQALRLRTALARLLDGAGIPDAEDAAWPVAAMLDGLIRDRVSGLSATLSPSTYEASVRRSVTALLRGLALTP